MELQTQRLRCLTQTFANIAAQQELDNVGGGGKFAHTRANTIAWTTRTLVEGLQDKARAALRTQKTGADWSSTRNTLGHACMCADSCEGGERCVQLLNNTQVHCWFRAECVTNS